MAEKEERIRVLLAKNPCKKCSVKKCTRKCMFAILFEKSPGMTRTEAINRMAKAIEERAVQIVGESSDSDPYKNPLAAEEFVDAALNTLLEDK